MQIETEEALKEKLQNLSEDIRNKFQENEVAVSNISLDDKMINVKIESQQNINKASDNLGRFSIS